MARLVAMVGFRVGAYPAAQPGPQSCGMINVGLFAAKRTNGSTFDEKARRISKGQKFSRACERECSEGMEERRQRRRRLVTNRLI